MLTNPGNKTTGDHPPPTGDFVDHPNSGADSAKQGYETTDVNTGGIIVFLGGLFGFVLIFFVFCFVMGRMINTGLNKQDGPSTKWNQTQMFGGKKTSGEMHNLESNSVIGQQELGRMTQEFKQPRLDVDDGNQGTADLHAKEDLLLDHYSTVQGQPLRIPIDRAMELVVAKGLPVASGPAAGEMMLGENRPSVHAPLTSGFARTGYELDTIEARQQKMMYSKAEGAEHASLQPVK